MNEGAAFEAVHPLQFVGRERAALASDVQHLAADHAGRTGSPRQQAYASQRLHRVVRRFARHLERECQERVASQYRRRFAEPHVQARLAAPQGVVVQRRQVVVNEREGMHEFHRRRQAVQDLAFAARQFPRCIDQSSAQPLAAAHGVAHRLEQPALVGPQTLRRRQQARQDGLHASTFALVGVNHGRKSSLQRLQDGSNCAA